MKWYYQKVPIRKAPGDYPSTWSHPSLNYLELISKHLQFCSDIQSEERMQAMKKSILILVLSLVLLAVSGLYAQAQPKEATESLTISWYVTTKFVPLGVDRIYLTYEAIGVTVTDTGEGLFHGATARTLGGMVIEKGFYNDELGYGVWNLQNGDKVFMTYKWAGQAGTGGIAKGSFTIIGGTGKCAGIQGRSDECTRTMVRGALEGVGQSFLEGKLQYKLP